LVAKKMFGQAQDVFAEQLSAKVRPARCQIMESLRKWQRGAVSTARGMKEIQAPESLQLVLGVVEALREGECIRERRDLGSVSGRYAARLAQRGVQPHFLAGFPSPSGCESAERLLDATA